MNDISTRQKTGFMLAVLLCLVNLASAFTPTPDGETGPPFAVLVLASVLGLVGLAAIAVAWRTGSRAAVRVAAGTLIVNALTSIPAFFVDVPALLKALVGLSVLATIAAVVLMFSPSRRPVPVMD